MDTFMARVERAAGFLGAIRLVGGDWAYRAAETDRWYVLDAEDIAALNDFLDHDDETIANDAYSHWCAAFPGYEKAPDWVPVAAL